MKTLLLLLAALPALAVTDSMTFTDAAGVPRTNEPIQFGRVFAQGEIPHYPQVLLNGTAAPTQANVQNRWPDGSAKHVIVSFLIPSVAVNGTANFTFQDQSICNCGPSARLTQSAMLASNFAFDAGVTVSGVTISARAMLSAWDGTTTTGVLDANAPNTTSPVSFWADGSIATTVILADHSATPAYDLAAGGSAPTIKSLRPIFICTFWPGINKVKVRFVLENVNTTTLQDLTYTAVLTTGTTPTQVYTTATTYPSGVLHQALTRWTKTYWIGGAPNDQYNLDHNLAYMASTFATPNWDTSKVVPASQITTDYNGWTSAQKDIYQPGLWQKAMNATGGRPDIGPATGWHVKWLFTGDWRHRQTALGQSELAGAWPMHFREGATGKFFDRNSAFPALGREISVNARPSMDWSQGYTQKGALAADKVNPVGSVSASTGWAWDAAHTPALNYVPYLLTGDYFFFEQLNMWRTFMEQWIVAGTCAYCRGATTTAGAIYKGQIRAEGWCIRDLSEAAWIMPDGTPEKALYTAWMDDVIASVDGVHNITSSAYCPTPTTCSSNAQWNWGHTVWITNGTESLPGSGAVVNTSVVNGQIQATLVNGGSGFRGALTDWAFLGFGGTGGNIQPTFSGGVLTNIAVTPGSNYTGALFGVGGAGTAQPSLYQWAFGNSNSNGQITPGGLGGYGVDQSACVTMINNFGYYYLSYALGRARELGFALTPVMRDWVDRWFINILTDPGFNPYLVQIGRACTTKMPSGQQFTSMADLLGTYYASPSLAIAQTAYHTQLDLQGHLISNQLAMWQGVNALAISDAQNGYEFLAAAAVAQMAQIGPGETQAWNWIGPKTNPSTLLNNTPTWAIIPRSLAYTSPPGISLQGLTMQANAGVAVEATNTQAIFRMPVWANSCTVDVRENGNLVHDVDPSYFSGAGTYTAGATRYFVVGKRTLEQSLTNGLQSRALHSATTHTYSVQCDAVAAIKGSFTTDTLAYSTYKEPITGAPLFDPTNRDEISIDPLTGTMVRKLTLPSDRALTTTGQAFQTTFPVTLSTTKVFIPADKAGVFVGNISLLRDNPDINQYSFHYFVVSGTLAANSVTVSACLTLDAATCAPHGNTYSTTSGVTSFIFGTTNVGDLWQQPGYPMYPATSIAKQQGNTVAQFGILAWTNTGTVALNNATYNYQMGTQPFWTFTGASDLCSTATVTGPNGHSGVNCFLPQNGAIYWVDTSTLQAHLIARYLNNTGNASADGCGAADSIIFDPQNADKWYCGGSSATAQLDNQQLYSFTYHGNHADTPGGAFEESATQANCNAQITNTPCTTAVDETSGSDLGTMLQTFDPSFQKDRFRGWYFVGVEDGKLIFRIWRSTHYGLGWTAVYDPVQKAIVAAISSWKSPGQRWCGQKSNEPVYTPGWLSVGPYPLDYGGTDQGIPGHGPYVVNAASTPSTVACPSPYTGTCATITVSGEPYNLFPCTTSPAACYNAVETGAAGEIGNAAVGDEFTIDGTGGTGSERMMLAQKTDATHWIFQRAINGVTTSITNANKLWTACNVNPAPLNLNAGGGAYWNYAVDPHGANPLTRDPYSINAHFFYQNQVQAEGYTTDSRCTGVGFGFGCYQVRTWTNFTNFVANPPSSVVTLAPGFAGKQAPADGNQVQQHPSGPGLNATNATKQYFFDARPFNGESLNTGGVNVSGNVWKFTAANVPYLDRKYMPTLATAGRTTLADVSSPAINGSMATPNTYCVAAAANECYAGSAVGDVYVNAAGVTRNYCYNVNQDTALPSTETDICIGNNSVVYNSLMQLPAMATDNTGALQRSLGIDFQTPRTQSIFDHSHALPGGSGLIYRIPRVNGNAYDQIFLVQVPPAPPADGIDRTNFITTPITVPALTGADNAVVEFGYGEYGGYCTSRAEACRVGTAGAAPFYFATAEAGSLTGVSCANGCTVNVPALPQHVLQGRIIYRAGSSTVGTGTPFVIATR